MDVIRAVLDTNVVVSAHLGPDGRQALLLELGLARRFRLCVSELLLSEYEGVLNRKRFGLSPGMVAKSILQIRQSALLVSPRRKLRITRDPDDNMVLECGWEASADYVVTGNLRHFPPQFGKLLVISPREFVTVLAAAME